MNPDRLGRFPNVRSRESDMRRKMTRRKLSEYDQIAAHGYIVDALASLGSAAKLSKNHPYICDSIQELSKIEKAFRELPR